MTDATAQAAMIEALVEALAECTHITHKAYVAATMEAVNSGPAHPLSKQMDDWRLRCLRAEEKARAALAQIKEPKP
jgi:invasion protein IalB